MVSKSDSTSKEGSKRRKMEVAKESPTPKQPKEDVYAAVIKHEEEEAKNRPAEKDAEMYNETVRDIKKYLYEVDELKKQPQTDEIKAQIDEKHTEVSLLFVLLKKLNRLDKIRIRNGRDKLHQEKLRVDSNKLQLQNLLYEADHLKKEVQRCLQFKSQDEDIELVPVEEFFEKAPATISRPEKTKKDDHALRLARLEWELEQRKELDTLCKKLQGQKKQIAKDIVSKTDRLESLGPCLQKLLESTRPLQESLDVKLEEEWELHRCARLLPTPLYYLYVNASAFAEACDPLLVVTINGDEDDAKQEVETKSTAEETPTMEIDSGDEDADMDADGEQTGKKRHHRQRQSKAAAIGQKRDSFFKPHPLSITLQVTAKEKGAVIAVTVQFLPALEIVTVQARLHHVEMSGVAAGGVILPDTILDHLYAGDAGAESPNPINKFQLAELQIAADSLVTLLGEKQLGKPYVWAQRLCGLDFVAAGPTAGGRGGEASNKLCENTVPAVVKQIRGRLQARVRLFKQILALEGGKTDVPSKSEEKLPLRISCSLLQWTALSFDEYAACPATAKFLEDGSLTPNDLFYRAIITRGSAKLECYIRVSLHFPDETPLWALALNWNGKHDSGTNSAIREIEFLVNSIDVSKRSRSILSVQLKRVMSCLDVFLETEAAAGGLTEFAQDKTFLRAFRGRQRSRPYKTVGNGTNVIYTQF